MKQNITLSVESDLLRQAKQLAAKRHLSLSRLLADDLAAHVAQAAQYEQAKQQALAWLEQKFHMGGKGIQNREALHDRQNLR
jgi:phage gpG-like protein